MRSDAFVDRSKLDGYVAPKRRESKLLAISTHENNSLTTVDMRMGRVDDGVTPPHWRLHRFIVQDPIVPTHVSLSMLFFDATYHLKGNEKYRTMQKCSV